MADPTLFVSEFDKAVLKKDDIEYEDPTCMDMLREQLFMISMTLKGNSWNDLMELPDKERTWLVNRCYKYHKKQEEEVKRAKSSMPRRRR